MGERPRIVSPEHLVSRTDWFTAEQIKWLYDYNIRWDRMGSYLLADCGADGDA